MEETTNEKVFTKKTWLNALKLFGKIAFAVVFVLFYIISSMFFISPNFDAKIFNFFGAKKAQEACYIRIYENSENNADLYNLILFESDLENYEKELYYLNLLMNSEDYESFCAKLDESALGTIEDASLIVYICNTNSYLINQKVKCMYNLGFDVGISATVRNYVKAQLNGDYRFETSFATYIDLIYNDASLSKAEKQQKVNMAYDSLETLVQSRLVFLTNFNSAVNISVKDNILSQHTIVELKKALYEIEIINESGSASSKKADYETALAEYNRLVASVYYD